MKPNDLMIIYFALVAFISLTIMSVHMHLNRLERKIDSMHCAKSVDTVK